MDQYVVFVYHHGGLLVRKSDGVLTYINGRVDELRKIDVDFVNLVDLLTLFKALGYVSCSKMLWHNPAEPDLDIGLKPLMKDSDVNAMCEVALAHGNRMHIYFDDCIADPDIIEQPHDCDESNGLFSGQHDSEEDNGMYTDSYDSVEDEPYRPPPSESDDSLEDEPCRPPPPTKEKKPYRKFVKKTEAKKNVGQQHSGEQVNEEEDNMSFETEGYSYNSEQLKTPPSTDDEDSVNPTFPQFNEQAQFGHVHLELGMEFMTLQQFKNALKDYNIWLGRQFVWLKNDKSRVRARCNVESCDWLIYCSWNSKLNTFQVKTFNDCHSCCRVFQNKKASGGWVASKLERRITSQPNMTRSEAIEHMKSEYSTHLHAKKVSKALKKAKATIEGCEKEQYSMLREYMAELLRSNTGSTCQIQVIPQTIPDAPPLFNRLYICLDACKKGFKAGCRPLIGLDGCFLKGYYGGQLLSAVGEDGNKQFYVIAYAIVDSETKDNWKWFLTLLQEDLGDQMIYGWNFISDQQKGLVPALKEVMPKAPHRFCMQHVWKNFCKQWKDKQIRALVWEAARCTTVPQFEKVMLKMKGLNEGAWKYLTKIEPSSWVKAYYSHYPKCDNITNNMAEVWNAKIGSYRSKPIITLCEELRCYIMRRMAAHKRVLGTVRGKIAPAQQKRLDVMKVASNAWTPTWTGSLVHDMYEVVGKGERLGVNLTLHTCACNLWQLTGVPCEHAIAAIAHKNEPVENYVHQWLTMEALHATYEHTLNPVNSQQYWPSSDAPKPIPPPLRRPAGRPKKHRKKDVTETQSRGTGKLKRSFEVRCPKCGQSGHYGKTCKGPALPRRSNANPVSLNCDSSQAQEILLSQEPHSQEIYTQLSQAPTRGSSPGPSATTMNAASSGTRARFMRFMNTPGFRAARLSGGN